MRPPVFTMTKRELDDALRSLAGSVPPDTGLPGQRELCSRFRVSTFALHRSLRQLAREGLIEVVPRKGIYVRRPAKVRRVLRVAYLDRPEVLRMNDYGLNAFMSAVGRHRMELRVTHMDAADGQELGHFLGMCEEERGNFGVVVTGYVDGDTAKFLSSVEQPWVMLGDVHSTRVWKELPIVTNDNFQGAQTAAEALLAEGCDRLILVNLAGDPDWSWVREARAGALAAAESFVEARIFVPECVAIERPQDIVTEAKAWIQNDPSSSIGILCRCQYALPIASAIRETLGPAREVTVAVFDVDLRPSVMPDILRFNCSMDSLAEAAVQRLGAIRRGVDSPGRLRLPFAPVTVQRAAPASPRRVHCG